jgi:predicted branched-subunit amino acid permease
MKDFTKSMKFIITFLFAILLLSMFTNQKVTYNFLVLVLLSMILLNSQKVEKMMGGLKYE